MEEEKFKRMCPNLFDAINANTESYFFYDGSIKINAHSHIGVIGFINRVENESYMVYFKFQFEKQLIPQNLN